MKRILILLTMLMIFVLPFQTQVQAQTTNLQDFKQYDSFQKKYYGHATDLIYYTSTAYQSNQHYFKENIDLYREAAIQTFNLNKDGFIASLFDSSEDLWTKPVAFLSTADDVRKYVFDKIKGYFAEDEYYSFSDGLTVPTGYYIAGESWGMGQGASYVDHQYVNLSSGYNKGVFTFTLSTQDYTYLNYVRATYNEDSSSPKGSLYNDLISKRNSGTLTLTDVFRVAELFPEENTKLSLKRIDDKTEVPYKTSNLSPAIADVFNNIINNYNDDNLKDYTPEVQPQLVCPNEIVPLTYQLGTFKAPDGSLVTISEDETANYLQTVCDLDFKFPEIYYHDDSNTLLIDGKDLSTLSGDISPIDTTFVDYIRNSYNYATTVVNTGVNGLKSILSGTTGLVALTGSMFSFLPIEFITLFVAGFSIALGLWVFKR